MMVPPNIQKLADYINSKPDPERFMMALLFFCKPRTNDLTDIEKESQV